MTASPVASLIHMLFVVSGMASGIIIGAAIGIPCKRLILKRAGLRMVYTKKGVRYVKIRQTR